MLDNRTAVDKKIPKLKINFEFTKYWNKWLEKKDLEINANSFKWTQNSTQVNLTYLFILHVLECVLSVKI